MNERIRELAEQAKLYAVKYANEHNPNISDEDWAKVYDEKFAELIVRECVSTLEFHGFDDAIPYIKWMTTNKLGMK